MAAYLFRLQYMGRLRIPLSLVLFPPRKTKKGKKIINAPHDPVLLHVLGGAVSAGALPVALGLAGPAAIAAGTERHRRGFGASPFLHYYYCRGRSRKVAAPSPVTALLLRNNILGWAVFPSPQPASEKPNKGANRRYYHEDATTLNDAFSSSDRHKWLS